MNDVSLRDLHIAYALLRFLTPARTRILRESFEPLSEACTAPLKVLEALLGVDAAEADLVRNPLRSKVARATLDDVRGCALTLVDDDYPPLLREICDPPLALFCRGDRSLFTRPCVAMVGSRRASAYAINVAEELASQLGRSGVVVVSGLARGVDAASHRAALDAGGGTIAVLGTGLDIIYPRSNRALFERIEDEGLIVSELPPGTPPLPPHFPIRNRIISGLTLGTIIVEATSKSGSLITARLAAEQGREVFAVPGSIFAAGSEGTHRLIQYGAKLVHDAADVLEELPGHLQLVARAPTPPPDTPLAEVLAAFTREEGLHIDLAATRLGRTSAALAEPLLQLELGGWLRALPGGRYVRVK